MVIRLLTSAERLIKPAVAIALMCAVLSACESSKKFPTSPTSESGGSTVLADRIERPEPVSIVCIGNGQVCAPRYARSVTANTFIQLRFVASSSHCAKVVVVFFVDGVESGRALLSPDESGPAWNVTVTPGTHLVELEGHGVVGGCNTGRLTGWAGTAFLAADSAERPSA